MDVLIAGAGVGGLAVASGLIADGHQVRVLESADALRPDGAAVTIYSNGAAALAGLGAPLPSTADPDAFGRRIDRLQFHTADGTRMSTIDMTVMRRRTGIPGRNRPAKSPHQSSPCRRPIAR